jgi:hypothetical protein
VSQTSYATGTTASPTRINPALDVTAALVGQATPRSHNLVAWTGDPVSASSPSAPTTGNMYLLGVYVSRYASVTKLWVGVNSAGSGATAGQNFLGLYNSAGTLLASVGVDSLVTSSAGAFSGTISSTAVIPGMYWVAVLLNVSGSTPQLVRHASAAASAALMYTVNQTGAGLRFAQQNTLTALPSPLTPSSNLTTSNPFWAAIS